jgi:ketosteroid isomerase-like protein
MSDTNIAVVRLLYNAFARVDIETILGSLAPDVEWHSGGDKQDYPIFGPRKGVAQVQEFFRLVSSSGFSDFSPQEFFAEKTR